MSCGRPARFSPAAAGTTSPPPSTTAAGDKNLEIFGANLAAQVLAAGLIDEIVAHVAPVLLGDGVRLYGASEDRGEVELERVDLAESGQVSSLRFRVKR